MANEQQKTKQEPASIEREAHDSGIVSPEKNKILEQHYKDHPEGDPAVRRIQPDRGSVPVEQVHDDGTMTVKEKSDREKKRAS